VASPRTRVPRRERQLRPPPPELLRAARKVFLRYGVQKSTMADIADEAGIPRPTLYEYVSSRNDLIDAVIAVRIRAIVSKLVKAATEAATFAEAVVETSIMGIELTRTDRELTNIFATTPYKQVHQIMEGPNPAVALLVSEFLQPLIKLGTAEALLRPDVTEELLVGWFRAVYSGFIYREDVDSEEIRILMRTFFLPSLITAAR
jgi:AcrR family transcriptional regulator